MARHAYQLTVSIGGHAAGAIVDLDDDDAFVKSGHAKLIEVSPPIKQAVEPVSEPVDPFAHPDGEPDDGD